MNALDPALFKACFTAWVEGFRETEPDIIAIDGKTSRRSLAHSRRHEPLWLAPTNGTRVYVSLRLQGRPDPATGPSAWKRATHLWTVSRASRGRR
jgi:hypothetical protein